MFFDSLFSMMAEKGASDIFVTAGSPIRMKVQGQVLSINQQRMEPAMIQSMLNEALSTTQLQRFENERELNFSLGRSQLGNFRINAFWQRNSPSIVIRHIRSEIPKFQELGLPEVLSDLAMTKRGLVLVVGATGEGKSTTIASMIEYRNQTRTGHILTVEDPIEYLYRHGKSIVNQREIGIDTHSWTHALQNAMRQAPDCIMIGEIRDRATMEAALAYALTGHLCISTLHANNAYHALNRITSFFPVENRPLLFQDLSVALKAVVAQRLVRRGDGMRIPSVEILSNSQLIADYIEKGEFHEIKDAMAKSLTAGSRTFDQDLYRLHKEGTISMDEALAHSDSPSNLAWLINNMQEAHASVADMRHVARANKLEPRRGAVLNNDTSFSEFKLDIPSEES